MLFTIAYNTKPREWHSFVMRLNKKYKGKHSFIPIFLGKTPVKEKKTDLAPVIIYRSYQEAFYIRTEDDRGSFGAPSLHLRKEHILIGGKSDPDYYTEQIHEITFLYP